jgi:hypothetical protein
MWLVQFLAVLLCASASAANDAYIGYSDYQVVTDARFDAGAYFRAMQEAGVNLQRIWIAGYGNTDPKLHETMPFARHGRKYNLRRFDPEYFRRLDSILDLAGRHGQRVMLTLFDHWQIANVERFVRTPWYYKNNTSRFLKNAQPDFYRTDRKEWASIQENYVRKIVRETRRHNPIYEIMNEAKMPGDCAGLARWHRSVAAWIREEHPGAEIAINTLDDCPALFEIPEPGWISLHYDAWSAGICDAAHSYEAYGKRILIDTDGAFVQRVDNALVRRWLNEALDCGLSFNHKDNIYTLDLEALETIREARTHALSTR